MNEAEFRDAGDLICLRLSRSPDLYTEKNLLWATCIRFQWTHFTVLAISMNLQVTIDTLRLFPHSDLNRGNEVVELGDEGEISYSSNGYRGIPSRATIFQLESVFSLLLGLETCTSDPDRARAHLLVRGIG